MQTAKIISHSPVETPDLVLNSFSNGDDAKAASQFVGVHMSRIFNFALLFLLAGIYYVQTDGFGAANATVDRTAEPVVTQVALVDVPKIVVPVKAVVAAVPVDPNLLTADELAAIQSHFLAKRLTASTVIVEVKTAAAPKLVDTTEYLQVSGRLVNVRAEPTTSSAVLAKLRRGTKVEPTGVSDGNWAQVIVSDTGQSVWMHSNFLAAQS